MKIYNNYGKNVHAIPLGTKELHYEKLTPVTLGSWTGKEIFEEFETSKKRRAIFMGGLRIYDNKEIWRLEREGQTVFTEAKMAFFQQNLKQHGHEQYNVFNDKLRTIGKRFMEEKGYTFEHGIEDTLKIWNQSIVRIEGKKYTPFELYVSSWKFFEYYMPRDKKWQKVRTYSYPIKNYVVEDLRFNILVHAVKWLMGDIAEMASQKLIQAANEKIGSGYPVDLCNNKRDQYKNIDLRYKNHEVSIKSGHTVTSENAFKMFSHASHTHIMGPAKMEVLEEPQNSVKMKKSELGLGISFQVKNLFFNDFKLFDREGNDVSLREFLR